jgi:hypothetical protein
MDSLAVAGWPDERSSADSTILRVDLADTFFRVAGSLPPHRASVRGGDSLLRRGRREGPAGRRRRCWWPGERSAVRKDVFA